MTASAYACLPLATHTLSRPQNYSPATAAATAAPAASFLPSTRTLHRSNGRVAHLYVSQSQEKSTGFLGALRRARNWSDQDLPLRNGASRPMIPASSRTTHPFAVYD